MHKSWIWDFYSEGCFLGAEERAQLAQRLQQHKLLSLIHGPLKILPSLPTPRGHGEHACNSSVEKLSCTDTWGSLVRQPGLHGKLMGSGKFCLSRN